MILTENNNHTVTLEGGRLQQTGSLTQDSAVRAVTAETVRRAQYGLPDENPSDFCRVRLFLRQDLDRDKASHICVAKDKKKARDKKKAKDKKKAEGQLARPTSHYILSRHVDNETLAKALDEFNHGWKCATVTSPSPILTKRRKMIIVANNSSIGWVWRSTP